MMIERAYRALLRILPRHFRERFGAEMAQMFSDEWSESNRPARIRLALRAGMGLFWTAIVVRLRSGYRGPRATTRRASAWSGIGMDMRATMRSLRMRPAYTVTAVLALGLGIGATTAVFSVVQSTVLRALQIPEVDRVVALWSEFAHSADAEFLLSAAELNDVRTDVALLDQTGAWFGGETALDARDGVEARTVSLANIIGDVYALTGARVVLGRLPGAPDDAPGAELVAVLSNGFWRQTYGQDPGVVGRTIPIGSASARIIGVLAEDVQLPDTRADVWVHRVLDPATWANNRSGHGLSAIGRLRAGATREQLQQEIAALQSRWAERYAGQHTLDGRTHTLELDLLGDHVLGSARRIGLLLSIAAGLLLILAAANVANLLLARGESRLAEVGVRLAMGAARARVARVVLIEGLTLSVAGAALGLTLAATGLPLLLRLAPPEIGALAETGVDRSSALFALAVSVLTGVLFTLLPSLIASRRDPALLLRTSGRGRTALGRSLRVMVGGQVAVATALLCAAVLLTRSMRELNAVSPGLATDARITLDLRLPLADYQNGARIIAFYQLARERLSALPGIERVAFMPGLPLRDAPRREGIRRDDAIDPDDRVPVLVQMGSAGILGVLGARLLYGRDLNEFDRDGNTRVVLINRSAAAALWPGQSALGRVLRATFPMPDSGRMTVVGVYEDMRSVSLVAPTTPEVILPSEQLPSMAGWLRSPTLIAQVSVAPAVAIAAARSALRELNPNIPAEMPATMRDVVRVSSARERMIATLIGVFATMATIIAAVGVFGVVSFTVAQRAREFAIRNALGATRGTVLREVLRSNAFIASTGALAGALAAWSAAPTLRGFLYNVAPRDALVFAGVPTALVIVALLSSLLPALRATRVSPADALNQVD